MIAAQLNPAGNDLRFSASNERNQETVSGNWHLVVGNRDGGAERINQEGRILGPAPEVSTPTLFNTPEADAIVSAMQILPVTNPWNEDISQRPRLANSDAMIAQIKSDLSPTRQNLTCLLRNELCARAGQSAAAYDSFSGLPGRIRSRRRRVS